MRCKPIWAPDKSVHEVEDKLTVLSAEPVASTHSLKGLKDKQLTSALWESE